ncbi:hypothetical protein MG293_012718 [Ovis ammon polii]|uniref:Uncharacterized protein n=1 Tax=Ovis ammon polii TaxID=230172 RepID=A0AAD4U5B1_OVIAM|nr:hypothetical protein MG293_012718 [Ovis ammon polii]
MPSGGLRDELTCTGYGKRRFVRHMLPGNICLSSPKLRLSFAVLYEMGRLPVAKAKDYDKYDGAFDRLRSLVTPKAGPPQGDRMVLGPMKGVTELQGPPLGNLTSSGSVVLWGGCLQSALSWGGSCAEDGLMMSISPQWMLLIVHSASSYILLFPESMYPHVDRLRSYSQFTGHRAGTTPFSDCADPNSLEPSETESFCFTEASQINTS